MAKYWWNLLFWAHVTFYFKASTPVHTLHFDYWPIIVRLARQKSLGQLCCELSLHTRTMCTECFFQSVAIFCREFQHNLRRPAWAVGSCSNSPSAKRTFQNVIFQTLRQTGKTLCSPLMRNLIITVISIACLLVLKCCFISTKRSHCFKLFLPLLSPLRQLVEFSKQIIPILVLIFVAFSEIMIMVVIMYK